MSLETLNVANALSDVLSRLGYDGAFDGDEPVEFGLSREEGHPVLSTRVNDGFQVKLYVDKLCITYVRDSQKIRDYHSEDVESESKAAIGKIKTKLQKEFRKLTGTSLGLKEDGDMSFDTDYISKVRLRSKACQFFKVGALSNLEQPDVDFDSSEKKLKKSIESFLSLKNEKRAKNDNAKQDSHEPFNPFKMKQGIRK